MIQRLKHLRRKKHPTLNNILIHRERILHNRNLLNAIQPGTTIIPVLKANAYGHGISQMCQILKESSASLLAVDSYPEYLQAKNMIDLPILIMGELAHETYQHLNPDKAQIAICSLSTLEFCKNLKKPFKIHIFLNTGMNRE
jgi:alanine racemase